MHTHMRTFLHRGLQVSAVATVALLTGMLPAGCGGTSAAASTDSPAPHPVDT
jgi:hypothetical protein